MGVIFSTPVFLDCLYSRIPSRITGAIFNTYDFWATFYDINRCLLRITGVIFDTRVFFGGGGWFECAFVFLLRIIGVIFSTLVLDNFVCY